MTFDVQKEGSLFNTFIHFSYKQTMHCWQQRSPLLQIHTSNTSYSTLFYYTYMYIAFQSQIHFISLVGCCVPMYNIIIMLLPLPHAAHKVSNLSFDFLFPSTFNDFTKLQYKKVHNFLGESTCVCVHVCVWLLIVQSETSIIHDIHAPQLSVREKYIRLHFTDINCLWLTNEIRGYFVKRKENSFSRFFPYRIFF